MSKRIVLFRSAAVLFGVLLLTASAQQPRVSQDQIRRARERSNQQYARQRAADAKRREEKKAEFEKKKEAEGLREWVLTGTLRGAGSTSQFIPDKPENKDDREIMPIMLGGKAKEAVEALLKAPLNTLNNKKVKLTLYGDPKRSGSRLSFNALSGEVQEWRAAETL
jgi:hypothetical protein